MKPILVRSDTQLASSVPIAKSVSTAPRVKVVSIPVDLKNGDLVQVTARVQATNDVGYNVAFDCYVIRDKSENPVDPIYGDRRMLRPLGRNITPDMHHDHRWPTDFENIGSDYVGYYHLYCYAANKTHPQEGDALTLDAGDAMIAALIFRDV